MKYQPKQERGRQRVNLILDAASEVFAEVGYEAATTILIAERAKTAVGSLYQFFPNKEAIARALAERYVERAKAMFDSVPIETFPALSLEAMTDLFLNPLREFIRGNHDFQVLFSSSYTSAAVAQAIRPMDEELLRRTDAAFALMRPDLSERERRKYGVVCMTMTKAMLGLAHLSDELTLDEIFEELRALTIRYLQPVMS